MKKFLIAICAVVLGFAGAQAQKGEMATGINLGVAPCVEKGSKVTNFGFGAKYQYNITDPIRLEANIDYWVKDKGIDMFDIAANAHYLLEVTDNIKVYPLVGIGFASLSAGSTSVSRFLFNIGVGGEYALTENISVGLEIKYQYLKDFMRIPFSIGATYHF